MDDVEVWLWFFNTHYPEEGVHCFADEDVHDPLEALWYLTKWPWLIFFEATEAEVRG